MSTTALLTLVILTAQAATDPIEIAAELRKSGRPDDAIRVLQEAFARDRKPEYLFWLSQHHQAAGRWVEAEQALLGALAFERPSWKRKAKPGQKSDFDKAAPALPPIQARLGTIQVRTEPADGVEVTLDGTLLGTSPLPPRRVIAGTVTVGVRKDGFISAQRPVLVSPMSTTVEVMKLVAREPEPAPPPPPAPVVAVPAPAPPPAPSPSPSLPPPDRSARASGLPAGFWILSASGLVGGAVGGTLLVLGENDAQKTVELGCSGRPADDAQCVDLNNSSSAKRTAGIIAVAAGGAALLGAGLVWLLSDDRDQAESGAWVAPMLKAPGVTVGGRF